MGADGKMSEVQIKISPGTRNTDCLRPNTGNANLNSARRLSFLIPCKVLFLAYAGFSFAAVISKRPRSLRKIRSEARKKEWRMYCDECDMELETTDAMFDLQKRVFMCEECADERGGSWTCVDDDWEAFDHR